MKKLIIILAIMLLPGATAYCQQAPTHQPTKAELEASLKQVQIEKRYLELQVQEQNLQAALDKLIKAEPKKEEKKAK